MRASAYAALAEAGKLDASSLHYFADTSGGKGLPALGAAQLGLAFARIGDKGKAQHWIDAALADKDPATWEPDMLPLLAANGVFDQRRLLPALGALSDVLVKSAHPAKDEDAFLRALWDVQARAGDWRAAVGGAAKTRRAVIALQAAQEKAGGAVRNIGDRPLHLVRARKEKAVLSGSRSLSRRIQDIEGREIHGRVQRGKTYVITLEGAWPVEGDASLVVYDDPSPGLRPVSCALDTPHSGGALTWLSETPPTQAAACEKAGEALYVRLDKGDARSGARSVWRVVYLATATTVAGVAEVAPPDAHIIGNDSARLMGGTLRLRVK